MYMQQSAACERQGPQLTQRGKEERGKVHYLASLCTIRHGDNVQRVSPVNVASVVRLISMACAALSPACHIAARRAYSQARY